MVAVIKKTNHYPARDSGCKERILTMTQQVKNLIDTYYNYNNQNAEVKPPPHPEPNSGSEELKRLFENFRMCAAAAAWTK